jgi:hypothetical protein
MLHQPKDPAPDPTCSKCVNYAVYYDDAQYSNLDTDLKTQNDAALQPIT